MTLFIDTQRRDTTVLYVIYLRFRDGHHTIINFLGFLLFLARLLFLILCISLLHLYNICLLSTSAAEDLAPRETYALGWSHLLFLLFIDYFSHDF